MAMSLSKVQALQKAAFFTHGFQGFMVFVLWVVLLALKAQKGGSPSAANVLFAMCFIAVPVIIYTAMTPRFPRTIKYSHPIAQTVLCFVSTIIWFAGFVSLAVYNNEGISKSEVEEGESKSCATTAYGTPTSCEISRAAIGLGVVVFLAFAVTTGMYAYTCYYLWKQNLPFTSHLRPGNVAVHDVEATTQDAFSHKDDPHMLDPQEDEHPQSPYETHTPTPGGVYAPLSGTAVGQGRWQGEDDDDDADFRRDNGYRNEHNSSVGIGHEGRMTPLTGHQDPYTDRVQQPVEFPDGPYNNTAYRY
ncbi:hypothetical protein TWF696_005643 [Orbilia brochopaga]|uniref:MARVEL domain-containing protein n=1 Tax=Orbilia brochopaga TaxID=3140254 RepID=A0AAV9V1E3_9PEZI